MTVNNIIIIISSPRNIWTYSISSTDPLRMLAHWYVSILRLWSSSHNDDSRNCTFLWRSIFFEGGGNCQWCAETFVFGFSGSRELLFTVELSTDFDRIRPLSPCNCQLYHNCWYWLCPGSIRLLVLLSSIRGRINP